MLRRAYLLAAALVLATLGSFVTAATALAASGNVVVYVEGPGAQGIRSEIVAAIPGGITQLPPSKLSDQLAAKGVKLRTSFRSAKQRRALVAQVHKSASAIGADAAVIGLVKPARKRGDREVQLLVVLASQEDPAVDETVPLPRGQKAGRRAVQWKNLVGVPLQDLSASSSKPAASKSETAKNETADEGPDKASSNEAEKTEEKTEGGEKAEESEEGGEADAKASASSSTAQPASAGTALVTGFLGLDFGGRQFHYSQPVTDANLRAYDLPTGALLPVVPGLAGAIELFPFANGEGILRDIGVTANGNYNFAKSQVAGKDISTTWYSFEANLRGRIHTGKRGASPLVGLEAGFGQLFFGFKNTGSLGASLPGVNYRYFRFGADVRIPTEKFAILLGAAYRMPTTTTCPSGAAPGTCTPGKAILAAGAIGERFPHAQMSGMDAKVGAALPLGSSVEARAVIEYTRFWSAFHPSLSATYVAGGAVDAFIHGDLGIAVFF